MRLVQRKYLWRFVIMSGESRQYPIRPIASISVIPSAGHPSQFSSSKDLQTGFLSCRKMGRMGGGTKRRSREGRERRTAIFDVCRIDRRCKKLAIASQRTDATKKEGIEPAEERRNTMRACHRECSWRWPVTALLWYSSLQCRYVVDVANGRFGHAKRGI